MSQRGRPPTFKDHLAPRTDRAPEGEGLSAEMIRGAQMRGARAMLRWTPHELAAHSKLPVEAIRRAERVDGEVPMTTAHQKAIRSAFEAAGLQFLDEDGGGPGIRLKRGSRPVDEGLRPDQLTSENDD